MAEVSIIVPVYKVPEQYLRKCIESCQQQILKDIQIILVDDGSPDHCGTICDEYASQDSRIKVIHKKNGGLSAARNTGFEASTSDWIMFVDGDDWIEPDMCGEMLKVAIRDDVQLVMCGIVRDYGHSKDIYKFYIPENKVFKGEDIAWLQEQLLHYNGNIAVAYSKLINRTFLAKNNIEHDEELRQGAEGLEFNLRLFECLESAEFINKPFYHYTYNDESISSFSTDANNEYIIRCFEKIKDFIQTSKNKDKLNKWFDNRLLYVIISSAISGFFNPANQESFRTRNKNFNAFLKKPIIKNALNSNNLAGLSKQRLIIVFLIKHNMYLCLNVLGKLRKVQKSKR